LAFRQFAKITSCIILIVFIAAVNISLLTLVLIKYSSFMCKMDRDTHQEPLLGSGMNNTLRDLGLETGLINDIIEQQVRGRFRGIGQRMSSFRVPPAVNSFWESCKKYAAENPVMAMTILALVITCAVPVIVFLSFAAITLLVTFIGFLCVEGTLLGIASVFLGGVLLIVGFFTLTFVSFGLVGYLVLSKVYTYFTGDTEPQRYLAKLPVIGYLFANIDHSGANGDAVKIPNGMEDDDAGDENLAHTD